MIAEIEEALLKHVRGLSAATPGLGYRIASVESYGGELDDLTAEVVRTFPAVWVTYAGGGKPKPVGTSREKWLTPATFVLMFGARNVRGEKFTRTGLKQGGQVIEVGAYNMLEDISLLTLNQDLGLKIDHFKPGAIRTLYNTRLGNQAVAVFAREFHTSYIERAPEQDLGYFGTLGIDYYLKPGDNTADASDTVTLT